MKVENGPEPRSQTCLRLFWCHDDDGDDGGGGGGDDGDGFLPITAQRLNSVMLVRHYSQDAAMMCHGYVMGTGVVTRTGDPAEVLPT